MIGPLKRRHLTVVFLGLATACSGAGAQMRGRISAGPTPSVHMAPSYRVRLGSTSSVTTAFQSYRPTTATRFTSYGRVIANFVPTRNLTSVGTVNGVPGLGFDYPHLVAVSAGLTNTSRNHFGRGRYVGQGSYVPILFGGYPYYYDSLDFDQPQPAEPQQEQPQVVVVQQEVPADNPRQDAYSGDDPGSASPLTAPVAPVRDIGDFILVRRDGRVLFASAFSVVGAQLQFVTPEGIRHTVPMSDLDSDATVQMNEARGTTVRLQN